MLLTYISFSSWLTFFTYLSRCLIWVNQYVWVYKRVRLGFNLIQSNISRCLNRRRKQIRGWQQRLRRRPRRQQRPSQGRGGRPRPRPLPNTSTSNDDALPCRFRELLWFLEPGYKDPGRTYLTSQLRLLYDAKRAKVGESFRDATFISLTMDCWSSRAQQGFMTVTAHFVDDTWTYQAVVLDTSPVITVDDDGNVVASRHKMRLPASWRELHRNGVLHPKWRRSFTTTLQMSRQSDYDAVGAIDMGCATHTLQLAVNRGLDECRQITTMIAGASRLVGHFRHSVIATKALEAKQESMGQDKKKTNCLRQNKMEFGVRYVGETSRNAMASLRGA